jgi:hypothetical protein
MLVHIIADYGPSDLAFAEVVQRLKGYLPDAEPVLTPVPPFATLAAGFCVAQLGLNPAPAGTLIYHNVAPRQDAREARVANAGERLAFARLPTGVRVIGVNAGYTFAFVREVAEELRWAAAPAAGSQFRSRDLFPQAAAAIALGRPGTGGGHRPVGHPRGAGAADCLYRWLRQPKDDHPVPYRCHAPGTIVRVRIGHAEQDAMVSDGALLSNPAACLGSGRRMAISPRQRDALDGALPTGGNAWEAFERPPVGARIEFIARTSSG